MVMIDYYPELAQDWSRTAEIVAEDYPWLLNRTSMSMRKTQLNSKLWLGDELEGQELGKVAVLGGWFCHYLTEILIGCLGAEHVTNYDIDPDAIALSRSTMHVTKPLICIMRKFAIPFLAKIKGDYDTIVNTSCEHMFPMKKIVDQHKGKLFVLQSSADRSYKDHINCVDNEFQLIEQSGLTDIVYAGQLEVSSTNTRIMVIGR